jgi:hypothetical protein
MTGATVELDALTHGERLALRALLIRATAAAGRPSAGGALEELVEAAPIEALPAAAAVHRVTGSILRGLDGVSGVPCDVTAELTVRQRQSSLHHLLIVGALSRIRGAFDEAGLAWVVMKGPVVAALLYPDVGDRSYSDLDLLLDRRSFPHAMRILEDLGYQHSIHNWALAEEMLAGQIELVGPIARVDLHWHLHYSQLDRRPFSIDPEAMVERARHVAVSGLTVPTLDPVDTLITLAFHAARSGGHRLLWLKDVERAVAVDEPDLDELVRRCRTYRCAPPVGLILGRARALLDAAVPADIVKATAPWALRAADRLASRLVHPVQLHERDTVTRWLSRSMRSSVLTTLAAVPARGARSLKRTMRAPPANESDSLDEKASYLRAVAASVKVG